MARKKKKGRPGYRWLAILAPILLLFACVSRPISNDERVAADAAIATIETGVVGLHVAGKIDAAAKDLALSQIAELREFVEEATTRPIAPSEIIARVSTLSLQWLGYDVTKKAPPPP